MIYYGAFRLPGQMKRFICLLFCALCSVAASEYHETRDYLRNILSPPVFDFPHLPEDTSDSSTGSAVHTHYRFNLPYYGKSAGGNGLSKQYSCTAHTWNIMYRIRRSKWEIYTAWYQHSLKTELSPDSDYKGTAAIPQNYFRLGGSGQIGPWVDIDATVAADPTYLEKIATDEKVSGLGSLSTSFTTPGIELSSTAAVNTRPLSGTISFMNHTPLSGRAAMINRNNNSKRLFDFLINENRWSASIRYDKNRHHLSLAGSAGFIDSSVYAFSDNDYPLVTRGNGFTTSFHYTPVFRSVRPVLHLSYLRYTLSFSGFDNLNRSFSRLGGLNVSLFDGSLQLIRRASPYSLTVFFTQSAAREGTGSLELYPFSSWITLTELNRFYLNSSAFSWKQLGVSWRYIHTIFMRQSLKTELGLSGCTITADAETAEGHLAFGGLLLMKENEQIHTLEKRYAIIKAEVTYAFPWKNVSPAITLQQYLPVEIRKTTSAHGSPASASSGSRTVFGGFSVSFSLTTGFQ
jgi:hypothetical protein